MYNVAMSAEKNHTVPLQQEIFAISRYIIKDNPEISSEDLTKRVGKELGTNFLNPGAFKSYVQYNLDRMEEKQTAISKKSSQD